MRNIKLARNIRLGVKNLMLHKLRSMLTMLGVVFGVGSVVAMLSVGEGASKEAMDQIRKLGSNNILVTSMKPVEEVQTQGGSMFRLSVYGLTYEDEQRVAETLPAVRRTVPAKIIRQEGRLGSRALELRVVGTTHQWFQLVPRQVLAGRVLADRDLADYGSVVVLTENGARKLLATASTIGQSVRIGGGYYEVIGIVKSESSKGGSGLPTPDQDVDAYIPINLARERFGDIVTTRTAGNFTREQVQLHQMIVEVNEIEQVPAVAQAIETMLQRFHRKVDYRLTVPLDLLRQAQATKRTFNIVLGSIAGISLLVGGIGIMNIMLASVTERTREIGIRRAIGAKKRQIIVQFLIETVVLSTVGGLIGLGIGVLIPALVTFFAEMPTQVTGWSLILSVGISLMVGIIFGVYPAMRAANLDPIAALRHE
jgi:putative ABC transport system permease protein